MNNNPLISFIVPIYNVEEYIDRCIQSLLMQGLNKNSYEIILVNDGSTDRSPVICQHYCDLHENVRIIFQENMRVGIARNTGIREAHGEYICFVDADDYLIENKICSIIKYCDGQNDLIRYWCKIIHPYTRYEKAEPDGHVTFQGNGLEYLREYGLETFCWNYLYRKDFVKKNNLLFANVISEDFLFINEVLFTNPNIISLAQRIYCYYIREGSIATLRTQNHSRRWVKDLLNNITKMKFLIDEYKNQDYLLYMKCNYSLERKVPYLFGRIMTSNYTLSEYKEILNQCRSLDLLPMMHLNGGIRLKLIRHVINLLSSWHVLYYPAKLLYKYLFLYLLYPKLDRNN